MPKALDMNGKLLMKDDTVYFHTHHGNKRQGVVTMDLGLTKKVGVLLEGDPFSVALSANRLEKVANISHTMKVKGKQPPKGARRMPAAEKVSGKELRKQAKSLGIDGWDEMSRKELEAAIAAAADDDEFDDEDEVLDEDEELEDEDEDSDDSDEDEDEDSDEDLDDEEDEEEEEAPKVSKKRTKPAAKAKKATAPAKKTSTKKAAPATKKGKTTKKATKRTVEVAENGNPYRPGSNLYLIAEELLRGGKRSQIVKRLHSKMSFRPRVDSGEEYEMEIVNSRLDLVIRQLRKDHGWDITREGRGTDSVIKASAE